MQGQSESPIISLNMWQKVWYLVIWIRPRVVNRGIHSFIVSGILHRNSITNYKYHQNWITRLKVMYFHKINMFDLVTWLCYLMANCMSWSYSHKIYISYSVFSVRELKPKQYCIFHEAAIRQCFWFTRTDFMLKTPTSGHILFVP